MLHKDVYAYVKRRTREIGISCEDAVNYAGTIIEARRNVMDKGMNLGFTTEEIPADLELEEGDTCPACGYGTMVYVDEFEAIVACNTCDWTHGGE